MKRNSLTTAVLAGFLGAASLFAPDQAEAVHINPDGTGQALIFPLFTAHDGNDTYISILNTSNEPKAVRIRFMEALNSRDVLGFNIYMGPFDVWTAAITKDQESGGAKLLTESTTCTVPQIPLSADGRWRSQEFLNFDFTGSFDDGGPSSLDRTLSGFIEVIEMGVLVDADPRRPGFSPATAVSKLNGVPRGCDAITDAWRVGPWGGSGQNIDRGIGIQPPTGGLAGSVGIINVARGTMFSYEATAIGGFWEPGLSGNQRHFAANSVRPNLSDAWNRATFVDDTGELIDLREWPTGIEAVNAALIQNSLDNEFSVNAGLAARTDWVVTFPTRRFHTDSDLTLPNLPGTAPFTTSWSGGGENGGEDNGRCEVLRYTVQNRDQSAREISLIPSPTPPNFVEFLSLCAGVNVLSFTKDRDLEARSSIFREPRRDGGFSFTPIFVTDDFEEGWTRVNLSEIGSEEGDGGTRSTRSSLGSDAIQLQGLPAIGFAATTFTNGNVGGLMSNYGASFSHRGSRDANLTPVALFSFSPDPDDFLAIAFNAEASFDSDGDIVNLVWDFGDGNTFSPEDPTIRDAVHRFNVEAGERGEFDVTLTVTDNRGASSTQTQTISVTAPPAARFSFTVEPGNPLRLTFNGSASSVAGGSITSFEWDFGDGNTFSPDPSVPTAVHEFNQFGTFDVTLKVTDNRGASNSVTRNIRVGTP